MNGGEFSPVATLGGEGQGRRVAIIGAGPAGLTAAYTLAQAGVKPVVFESDPEHVGGIARTIEHNGFRFDIGGHRFYSKSREIEALWSELLPHDLLERPRISRIYYRGKFFSYPLRPLEALWQLGCLESFRCLASYAKAHLLPHPKPRSFEDWVTNCFGKRLYRIFFQTYTEKVWGMRCSEISADWAAQRIHGLSLGAALRDAFGMRRNGNGTVKSLIQKFRYPRLGPGMMWDACAERVRELGGEVRLGRRVVNCEFLPSRERRWRITSEDADGEQYVTPVHDVISSTSIGTLEKMIRPGFSTPGAVAAQSLRYRDFLIVALILNTSDGFPDNWIYVHDEGVRVGRIQNFRSWSPDLVPDPSCTCYGMEYFCSRGDELWSMSDGDLTGLASREIERIGLASRANLVDSCVIRQRRAYPVYDHEYGRHVDAVRREIEAGYPGLHLVGRNGMHKYNNQDHSMMTAILTARNILAGERLYDVWKVNQDAEYQETVVSPEPSGASGLRAVPVRIPIS